MTKKSKGSDRSESKSTPDRPEVILKSEDAIVQRFNEATHSVVSDGAIDRASESPPLQSSLHPTSASPKDEIASALTQAAPTLDNLEIAVAKADALVQSLERRQSEIEDAHSKAKEILDEVNRIAEALTMSDVLRERINATVARTKRLRGNDGNPLG